MGLEMPFDFVRAAETFSTHRTAVGLLSGVDSHVYLQVSHLCKALSTNLTAEWFFSCVATLVLLKSARRAAAFPTHSTAIWFFSSVHLYMHMQVANVTKCLSTNFTAKRRHMALQGGFLMRAVHSISCLITHVRGLSSVSSIASSLCTNHLPTILHTNNVNVVLIWAVWVDWRKRLGTAVGGHRATVASTLYLHMSLGASRSRVPLPVLYTLALREVGCVGTILGVFISNTRGSEHVLWCGARAMTPELIISLVTPQISLIFDLDRNALFMAHAGTPLSAWMLTILLI